MARGRRLCPFEPGDVVGGFKILRVGEDHSSKTAQTYHVERTCECRERLHVTHEHIVRRRTAGISCCRGCAMARLSFMQALSPPRRVWTEAMDGQLRRLAGTLPAHAIAARLDLENPYSVYRRARHLGIRLRKSHESYTTRPERATTSTDPR